MAARLSADLFSANLLPSPHYAASGLDNLLYLCFFVGIVVIFSHVAMWENGGKRKSGEKRLAVRMLLRQRCQFCIPAHLAPQSESKKAFPQFADLGKQQSLSEKLVELKVRAY